MQQDERERGGGLVLVAIATLIVALLVEALLTASHAETRAARGVSARTDAYYAALAGVWAVAHDVGADGTGGGQVSGRVDAQGYTVDPLAADERDELSGAQTPDGWPDLTPEPAFRLLASGSFEARSVVVEGGEHRRVIARGVVDDEVRVLEAVLRRGEDALRPFTHGLFSDAPLVLASNNPVLDSFRSSLGSYASQLDAELGRARDQGGVASNSDVSLGSGVVVYGDARPGPGSTLTLGSGSQATGDTTPLPVTTPLPAPAWTVPQPGDPGVDDARPYGEALSLKGSETVTLGPGKYVFSSVKLDDKNAVLELTGTAQDTIELYITGGADAGSLPSLWLKKGKVTITGAGQPEDGLPTVKILNAGKLETEATTAINYTGVAPSGTEGPPASLQYYSTYRSDPEDLADLGVKISSPGAFSGVIYAPDAFVDIASNGHVFGAVLGKRVVVSSNCRVHYDEDLAQLTPLGVVPREAYSIVVLRELR